MRALAALLLLALAPAAAMAQDFLGRTVLTGAGISEHSETVQQLSHGSTQLSDGAEVPFRTWYSSARQDVHFTWLTALRPGLGLIWGLGTGEGGEKYRIDPSLRLGFVTSREVAENQTLSLRMSVVLGGALQERTCTADYGAIGGVQTVNCRLAASTLRPADTLVYLLDEPPAEQVQASLTWKLRF